MDSSRTVKRRAGTWPRRWLGMLLSLVLTLGTLGLAAPAAHAAATHVSATGNSRRRQQTTSAATETAPKRRNAPLKSGPIPPPPGPPPGPVLLALRKSAGCASARASRWIRWGSNFQSVIPAASRTTASTAPRMGTNARQPKRQGR